MKIVRAFLRRTTVTPSMAIDGDSEKTLFYYTICQRCQGNEGVFKGRGWEDLVSQRIEIKKAALRQAQGRLFATHSG
jgi:hypothetical protein